MHPPQPPQFLVPKRLHAETQTIDTGATKLFQAFGGDRLRIGLERHLGVGGQRERRPRPIDDGCDIGRREE